LSSRRALFLDRDGVINHDSGYVGRIEDFRFIEGIFNLTRTAVQNGLLAIVVTNQAGIGRGYYTEDDFLCLTEWMCDRFAAEGAPLTDVFYCPYHPEFGIGRYRVASYDRKPNPGMLLRAADRYGLSLADSMMVGDKGSDMDAALNAGVGARCYLGLGRTPFDVPAAATHVAKSLAEATSILFHHRFGGAGELTDAES